MSDLKRINNKTGVKFLINTVAALTVGMVSSTGWGETPAPAPANTSLIQAFNPCALPSEKDQKRCDDKQKAEECITKKKDALAANKELLKACGDGGFTPTSACLEKAMACEIVPRELPADSGVNWNDAVNTILKSAGMNTAAGVGGSSTSSAAVDDGAPKSDNDCSNMTSEDYNSQRKSLDDDLKSLQKELNDAQKELTTEQKDAKKEIADIQDDITKEKASIEKDKAQVDTDQRKQVSDFMQTQNDIKNQLRSKTLQVIKLRGDLVKSQREQTQQLLQLNDAAIQSSCAKQAQTSYSDFQKAASLGSMTFATRKAQKQMVIDQYNSCMTQLEQQRIGIIENKRAEQQALTTSISQTQAESGDIQASIDSAQTQLSQMQQQNTDQKAKMDQNLLTKMQTATTKMQTASTDLAQKQQISTARQDDINKNINKVQNKLKALGTRPPSGAKMAPKLVGEAIQGSAETIVAYTNECCPKPPPSKVGQTSLDSLCDKATTFKALANGESVSASSSGTKKSTTKKPAGQ